MRTRTILALTGVALAAGVTLNYAARQAELAGVKAALAPHVGAGIDEVRQAPVPGLFEARIGSDFIYADQTARYVLSGDLIDTQTGENLTERRRSELSLITWPDLPLTQAIQTVNGHGSRHIAVFADPNCRHCQQLEQTLRTLDDVTIHTFALPILSQQSVELTSAVLCSAQPARAWHDWMLRRQAPTPNVACAPQAEALRALGQRLGIRGTPVVIFPDGTRIDGNAERSVIVQRLDRMARAAK